MKTKHVDILNIGLIILTAFLAYLYPMELFVFAYAILGPLHYLTEINWLDKKGYFTPERRKMWMWIGIISTSLIVLPKIYLNLVSNEPSTMRSVMEFINYWSNAMIFLTILLAVGVVFIKRKVIWVALMVIGLVAAILLNGFNSYTIIIGLLIPTILHVYVFTLLFMLYGAKKSKSVWGFVSAAMAVLAPLFFAYVNLDGVAYHFSDEIRMAYEGNNFHQTPALFANFIGIAEFKQFFVYEQLELRLMMFISFIYTYHYLNWFSKTSLIEWHKSLTVRNSIVIGIAAVAMIALFYYDYRLGFLVSLFFSFLHVILEFPLNVVSLRGLFTKTSS